MNLSKSNLRKCVVYLNLTPRRIIQCVGFKLVGSWTVDSHLY